MCHFRWQFWLILVICNAGLMYVGKTIKKGKHRFSIFFHVKARRQAELRKLLLFTSACLNELLEHATILVFFVHLINLNLQLDNKHMQRCLLIWMEKVQAAMLWQYFHTGYGTEGSKESFALQSCERWQRKGLKLSLKYETKCHDGVSKRKLCRIMLWGRYSWWCCSG